MTETALTHLQEARTGRDTSFRPVEVLMNLIVAFLVPMFLSASGGNISFARAAAIETINAYRTRNQTDLMSIAQVIAFGFAALGSLSLSLADDISVAMALRLRGNAIACNRSAEQHRRALRQSQSETNYPARTAEPAEQFNQVAPVAAVPTVKQAATDRQPTATATTSRARWATAMSGAAQKLTTSIASLLPNERQAASLRTSALSSTANTLLAAVNTSPIIRPPAIPPKRR